MWMFHIGSEAYGIVCSALSTITPRRDWTCDYPLCFHKRIEEGEMHVAVARDYTYKDRHHFGCAVAAFGPNGRLLTATGRRYDEHGAGCTRREPSADLCPNCLDSFGGDHPERTEACDRPSWRPATSGFETSRSTGGS